MRSHRDEASVLAKVKELLNEGGRLGLRVTNVTGMPDMIGCVNGRFVGVEVKDDVNGSYKLTKAQKIRLAQVRKAGGYGWAVDRAGLEPFADMLDRLENGEELPRKWGYV
ncbi:hypothetical protein EL753P1_00047 [Eggerthella phage EL753P1]|jgi:hypothetical protein|nr:hypothetical protein EL753P1_00047 [Eggerthella phage EL753P1]